MLVAGLTTTTGMRHTGTMAATPPSVTKIRCYICPGCTHELAILTYLQGDPATTVASPCYVVV